MTPAYREPADFSDLRIGDTVMSLDPDSLCPSDALAGGVTARIDQCKDCQRATDHRGLLVARSDWPHIIRRTIR